MISRLEQLCVDKGLKMTDQRRVIARVLSDAADHPDVEAVYRRATEVDPRISIATVYRTVRLFEEFNILTRHDFGDGRARYEERPTDHHDHLIDVQSGKVIEFQNEAIEELQRRVAEQLGFRLIDHRLELFAVPLGRPDTDEAVGASDRGQRPALAPAPAGVAGSGHGDAAGYAERKE